MTADADKGNFVCLICNASIGVSTRNSCPIFKYNVTSSEQPVANILSVILGQEVRQELVHSEIICKKCFKLCNEVDELQERLAEIKIEINNYYQKTLRKLEGHTDEDDDIGSSQVIILPRNNKLSTLTPVLNTAPGTGPKRGRPKKFAFSDDHIDSRSLVNSGEEIVVGESDEDDPQGIGVGMDDENDSDYTPDINRTDKQMRKLDEAVIAAHDGVQIKLEVLDEDEMAVEAHNKKQLVTSQSSCSPKKNVPDLPSIIPQMIVNRTDKMYTCLLCSAENKVQGEAKAITLHMKAEHNIRLYICDMCGVEFLKRSEMSAHFDQHVANEEGDFQCDICNRIFSNLRLFRVHKRMHLPQAKNHVCETCGKAYLSRNMLEEHYNTHTGARPYKCTECGKDFASKYTLRAHEKTHTDRPRPYKCAQCGKGFITEQNLIQHDRTHSAVRNFTCQICGKAFSSARNLEVHCVIHTGYKPFICRICGKAFARKAEIRDHERTHTGEKPYQCEFCGATFGQRSNLQSHKRATHYDDKRYQCVDCGKAFKRRRLLDYHIKAAHTGERPFKCQVCGATFIYPEHFKKHRRIHTGEKPYQCEVCGKAFNSRDNRNAHRFVHSDKKPYECLVCGMGFMRKPQLYNHMQVQGHVNDTIVVNQPRLTTEEDLIPQADEVEMAIITEPDGTHKLIHPDQVHEVHDQDGDTKMFISELKEHVIIQGKGGEQVVVDDQHHYNEVGHLIIDGQIVDQETLELEGAGDGTAALVVRGAEIGPDGTTQVQTADGQVHLVQISIPDSDQPAWFNIVHQ